MEEKINTSIIGRLLNEISWEGKFVKRYRNGGAGYENVLTAEFFQALDFLPRNQFFSVFLESLNGLNNNPAIRTLVNQVEDISVKLLPGNFYLKPSQDSHQAAIGVQPDAIIETKDVYALVEAKRIKRSSFQKEQLAREYLITLRESNGRAPLLILLLGKKPPIQVKEEGLKSIRENLEDNLESVLDKIEGITYTYQELLDMIDSTVYYLTWEEIYSIIKLQRDNYGNDCASTKMAILRIADTFLNSIENHR